MEYQLKNDSIEAYQLGSEDAPEWVAELIVDGTIKPANPASHAASFIIGTDEGPKPAELGDYVTFQPTVWGEVTDEAPQGEILAYRSVTLISKGDFEALYDVPQADAPAAPVAPEGSLIANGEAAKPATDEDLERQYR